MPTLGPIDSHWSIGAAVRDAESRVYSVSSCNLAIFFFLGPKLGELIHCQLDVDLAEAIALRNGLSLIRSLGLPNVQTESGSAIDQ